MAYNKLTLGITRQWMDEGHARNYWGHDHERESYTISRHMFSMLNNSNVTESLE